MKIINYTLLFTLLLYTLLIPIGAQTRAPLTTDEQSDLYTEDRPPEITDVQALRAEFVQNTQNPGSKKVRFDMILASNITTDRVRVTWDVTGSLVTDRFPQTQVLSLVAGNTYRISIEVQPIGAGVTEVYGVARASGVDSNIVATVRKNFATNESGEVLPITDEYRQARIMHIVFVVFRTILILVVLVIAGVFGYKKFKKWYNTDQQL